MSNTVRATQKQEISSKFLDLLGKPAESTQRAAATSSPESRLQAAVDDTLRFLDTSRAYRTPGTPEAKVLQMVFGTKLTQRSAAHKVKDLLASDLQAYSGMDRASVADLADKVIAYRGYQGFRSHQVGVRAAVPGAILGAICGAVLGVVTAAPIRGVKGIWRGDSLSEMRNGVSDGAWIGACIGGGLTAAMALPVTAAIHLQERRQGKVAAVDGFPPWRAAADVATSARCFPLSL